MGSEWTANLVMSPHAAGLLIGRGGKKIKLLQEDSGVRVQVHELPNGERALELAGPPVELQDGLELLIAELARMPDALAPKAAQMLVPEEFAEDCAAEALKYGASAVMDPKFLLPGENLLMIEGSTAVRGRAATAVAAFLARKLWRPGEEPKKRVFRSEATRPGPSTSESEKLPVIPWRLDAGEHHNQSASAERMRSAKSRDEAPTVHPAAPVSPAMPPMRLWMPKSAVLHLAQGSFPALASKFNLHIEVNGTMDPSFAEVCLYGGLTSVAMSLLLLQPLRI